MKTTTSSKIAENLQVALTATGFISIVMVLCYISWFA